MGKNTTWLCTQVYLQRMETHLQNSDTEAMAQAKTREHKIMKGFAHCPLHNWTMSTVWSHQLGSIKFSLSQKLSFVSSPVTSVVVKWFNQNTGRLFYVVCRVPEIMQGRGVSFPPKSFLPSYKEIVFIPLFFQLILFISKLIILSLHYIWYPDGFYLFLTLLLFSY